MSIIYKCAFGEWRAIALSKMEINAIITKIKVLLFSVFCVMNQAASTDGAQREMSPRSSGDLWPAPVPPPSDHHSPQVRALVLPEAWGEGFPQRAGMRGVRMLLRARLGSWGPHISPGISPGMRRRFRGLGRSTGDTSAPFPPPTAAYTIPCSWNAFPLRICWKTIWKLSLSSLLSRLCPALGMDGHFTLGARGIRSCAVLPSKVIWPHANCEWRLWIHVLAALRPALWL